MGAWGVNQAGIAGERYMGAVAQRQRCAIRGRELAKLIRTLEAPDVHGCLVTGPAGSGKSFLAHRGIEQRDGSIYDFLVRGSDYSSRIPYAALAAALTQTRSSSLEDLPTVLHELRRFLAERAGGRPVVIVLEKAELVDAQSATVVCQLARFGEVRLILLAADAVGLPAAFREMWSEGALERIDLGFLEEGDARMLLEAELGAPLSPTAVDYLWNIGEGNPRYIMALAADGAAAGKLVQHGGVWTLASKPDDLGSHTVRAVTALVDDLTSGQRGLLETVAHQGVASFASLLQARPGTDCDALQARGLIVADASNPSLAVLSSQLLGEVMRRDDDLHPGTAWHGTGSLCAGVPPAGGGDGNRQASAVLGRVRWLIERLHLEEALSTIRSCRDQFPDLGPEPFRRLVLAESWCLCRLHRSAAASSALEALAEPRESSSGSPGTETGSRAEAALATAHELLIRAEIAADSGDYQGIPALLARIPRTVLSQNLEVRAMADAWMCEVHAVAGNCSESESLSVGLRGLVRGNRLGRMARAQVAERMGRAEILRGSLARTRGGETGPAWPGGISAPLLDVVLALFAGDVDTALEGAGPLLQQLEIWDADGSTSITAGIAACCHAVRQEEAEARHWLGWTRETDHGWFYGRLAHSLAAQARRLLQADPPGGPGHGTDPEGANALLATALAAVQADLQSADGVDAGQAAGHRPSGSALALQRPSRSQRAARVDGREQAGPAGRRRGYPVMQKAHTAPIDVAARSGNPAGGDVGKALSTLERRHLSTLTRRERQSVGHVAQGWSNREIAEASGLSVRTVEGHLYQAYAKLQVSGRRELLAQLRGAGT